MPLDLSDSPEEATPEAAPAEGAAPTEAGQPAAPAAGAPPAAPAAPAKQEPKPEDRIIELSRSNREHAKKASTAEKERDSFKAQVEELAPVVELIRLGKTDPLKAIDELAEAFGITAETALESLAKRRAGEKRDLSPDERVARLEREIRERDAREAKEREEATKRTKEAEDERAIRVHKENLASTLKSKLADFPLAEAEGKQAIEGAFELMVLHYQDTGQVMPYDQALGSIEKTLREETERRAAKLGYQRTPGNGQRPPQSIGGLSNSLMAPAPSQDQDRILSDEEIEAISRQMFGGG